MTVRTARSASSSGRSRGGLAGEEVACLDSRHARATEPTPLRSQRPPWALAERAPTATDTTLRRVRATSATSIAVSTRVWAPAVPTEARSESPRVAPRTPPAMSPPSAARSPHQRCSAVAAVAMMARVPSTRPTAMGRVVRRNIRTALTASDQGMSSEAVPRAVANTSATRRPTGPAQSAPPRASKLRRAIAVSAASADRMSPATSCRLGCAIGAASRRRFMGGEAMRAIKHIRPGEREIPARRSAMLRC